MTAPRRPLSLALLLGLGLVTLAPRAQAGDKETAKDLFDKGLEAMEAKRFDDACPAIEQSMKLDPYPGTLFTLAECEALRGRGAAALRRYTEYLALYATLPRDKQAKQGTREKEARAKKTELEGTVPALTLVLPAGAPAGVEVTRDGEVVPADQLGVAVSVEVGDHVLTTRAPGAPVKEQRITLEKGEKRELTLEVTKPPPKTPPPPPAPPETGPGARRILVYTTGGLGVAGLALGGVMGGLMLAQQDAIAKGCNDVSPGVAHCTKAGAAAGNDAKMFGTIATIGFAAGAAAAGVALTLLLTEPKKAAPAGAASLTVRPTGDGVTATLERSF